MKIIQQANRVARENAKMINNVIKRDRKRAAAVLTALKRAGIQIGHVHVDSCSYNVSITGTRADLDIMFGVLRRAGLTPSSRPQEKESYYSTFWHWENESSNYLWVSFSSTSCKRVKTGTELKEVDVYETVCED